MAKVTVAVPTTGWIHSSVAGCLLYFQNNNLGHDLEIVFGIEKPIDANRNQIIKEFLEGPNDYLFFIDSDNPPSGSKNALELIDLDKDVLVLPTPIWKNSSEPVCGFPVFFNCYDLKWGESPERSFVKAAEELVEHLPRTGLQKVYTGGSGSLIISRRVLEEIRPAFQRVWNEDGLVDIGSDINFCARATRAGFDVYAHYDYPCHHIKERDLLALFRMMGARDIKHANSANPVTPDFWDREWEVQTGRSGLQIYDYIVEQVSGGSVLDYGCGSGELLEQLGPEAVGLDYSQKAIDIVKSKGLKGEVGDSVEGQWDSIVCVDVLPEIEDDRGKIEEFFEHAKKVVIVVPNNCMPPGLAIYNLRVYTPQYLADLMPYMDDMFCVGDHLICVGTKDG